MIPVITFLLIAIVLNQYCRWFVKGVWLQRALCNEYGNGQRLAERCRAQSAEHGTRRVGLLLASRHTVPVLSTDGVATGEPL